jgi:hypothetical protein
MIAQSYSQAAPSMLVHGPPDRPLGLPGHAALDRSRPSVELPPTHGRAGCGQGPIPSPRTRCLTSWPHLRTSWNNNGNLLDGFINLFCLWPSCRRPSRPHCPLWLRSFWIQDIPSLLHSLLDKLTEEPSTVQTSHTLTFRAVKKTSLYRSKLQVRRICTGYTPKLLSAWLFVSCTRTPIALI